MTFPFDEEIKLETSFALLRPLQLFDVSNLLHVAASDKNLLQFSPLPVFTEELLRQYIEKAILDWQNKNRYPFIIFDKTQNAYAGSTSFLNISNADNRLEIGSTWIGNEFQKTGLNRNCKYLMLSFAFDKLNAERVEFRTDERNLKSRRSIEKIGGQYEGLLRSHTLMLDGFRRNTVCYSILRNEWTATKNNFLRP
jgi:N-acetyltransferase